MGHGIITRRGGEGVKSGTTAISSYSTTLSLPNAIGKHNVIVQGVPNFESVYCYAVYTVECKIARIAYNNASYDVTFNSDTGLLTLPYSFNAGSYLYWAW